MAEWLTYRERCKKLEAEIESLKCQPATAEQTVERLLKSAGTLIEAAKTVIEIRSKEQHMGTISDGPETAGLTCNYCGNSIADADLYRCDECEKVFCEDCAPNREDDAPIDVCEQCMLADL